MDTPGGHVVSSAEHTVGLLLCVSQGIELLCEEGVKPLTKSPEEVKDLRGRTVRGLPTTYVSCFAVRLM